MALVSDIHFVPFTLTCVGHPGLSFLAFSNFCRWPPGLGSLARAIGPHRK